MGNLTHVQTQRRDAVGMGKTPANATANDGRTKEGCEGKEGMDDPHVRITSLFIAKGMCSEGKANNWLAKLRKTLSEVLYIVC